MKSRKRGELQTAVVAAADKHKVWLIIGIVLAVVLVLVLIFYSPLRETVAGRASATSTGVTPVQIRQAATCYNASTFPLRPSAYVGSGELRPTKSSNQDKFVTTVSRMDFCETILGCTFQGYENTDADSVTYNGDNTYNPSDDLCIGTAPRCLPPDFLFGGGQPNFDGVYVDLLFQRRGNVWNTARKNACESINTVAGTGCYFHDRGGTNVSNSLSADIVSDDGEEVWHHSQDACFPFGVEGASCSVSGASGAWVYSFLPGETESLPLFGSTETIPAFPPMTREDDDASRRTACCADATSCANVQHQCIGRDTEYTYGRNNASDFICGDDNNWDRCGPPTSEAYNKHSGDASDGDDYVCQQVEGEYTWVPVAPPVELLCDDGIDNDGNEQIDCADDGCFGQVGFTPDNPGVLESGVLCRDDECLCTADESDEVLCTDGFDNDADGQIDCADDGCFGQVGFTPDNPGVLESGVLCRDDDCFCAADESNSVLCADGFDNDADGVADCADTSCAAEESCVEETTAVAPAAVRGNVYTDYNYDVDPPALLDPQLLDTNDLLMLSLLIEANADDRGNAGNRPYRGDFYGYPVWVCDNGHYSFTELVTCPRGGVFSDEANVYTDYNYDVDPPALLDPQLLDTNDLLMLSLLIEANADALGNAGAAPYRGDFYGYPVWVCDDGDYSFTEGEITSC